MFLKNKNIIFKIKRPKVTDYAALIAHADVSSDAIGLNLGPSLHLHPYFVHASNEGSWESAHLRRLL